MARESYEQALLRWDKLRLLQAHYKEFRTFLVDVIEGLMGFVCTDQQMDIADYLQYGPAHSMVQAQRGQAKTTITGAFAVWQLIHDPTCRTLVLSGGGDVATEISNWIIQIIQNMTVLECMRPDPAEGDRVSVHSFDIHYSLRGTEKSPSIACKGIKGQLQGKRADLLIADDIETKTNSETEQQREKLRDGTRDFTSICSVGKIVYLGTPQSIDSIYNSLAERGYDIRIWPGRFPTEDEEQNYHGCLAPYITERMAADPTLRTGGGPTGDRGKPTDPAILDEATLTQKEIDQGPAYFQLQHMLDTRLMDKDRYPLSLARILFTHVQPKRMPIQLDFAPSVGNTVSLPNGHPLRSTPLYMTSGGSTEFNDFQGTYMYIDPSGGGKNGDELAWAVTRFLAGYVYLVDIGGIPGGLHEDNLKFLSDLALKWEPQKIGVERNFGNGALVQVWAPLLRKVYNCTIDEPWESGQKELRIIDILEPLVGSGRLVVDVSLVDRDWVLCQQYPLDVRSTYSFFYQFAKITRERGALLHDDRLDALAGACRPWAHLLAQDKEQVLEDSRRQALLEFKANPKCKPAYALEDDGDEYITSNTRFRRRIR